MDFANLLPSSISDNLIINRIFLFKSHLSSAVVQQHSNNLQIQWDYSKIMSDSHGIRCLKIAVVMFSVP